MKNPYYSRIPQLSELIGRYKSVLLSEQALRHARNDLDKYEIVGLAFVLASLRLEHDFSMGRPLKSEYDALAKYVEDVVHVDRVPHLFEIPDPASKELIAKVLSYTMEVLQDNRIMFARRFNRFQFLQRDIEAELETCKGDIAQAYFRLFEVVYRR